MKTTTRAMITLHLDLVPAYGDQDNEAIKRMDTDVVSKIVAATGASTNSLKTFFVKQEHHSQKILEIGV